MTTITWKPLAGGRALAPYRGTERLPFTVCSYGPPSAKFYEAWDKRGAWSSCLATNLATPEEAKGVVMAEIARAGL